MDTAHNRTGTQFMPYTINRDIREQRTKKMASFPSFDSGTAEPMPDTHCYIVKLRLSISSFARRRFGYGREGGVDVRIRVFITH